MGPMIFGQVENVKPEFLHQFVLVFLGILGGAAAVAALKGAFGKSKREISNQPLEVESETKVTPKGRRFSAFECDAKHSALKEAIDRIDNFARIEISRVHDKIDEVEHRGNDKLSEAIKEMNTTIRNLPADVIKLLRATGQLKDHHD